MSSKADKLFSGIVLFWLIWFALKIIALPVLIVNIIYLIGAVQHGNVGTFDFGWLVISAAGVIIL